MHKDKYNHPTIEGRNDALICPSGFYDGKNYEPFDHMKIREHVIHSWYEDYPSTHPWSEPMPEPLPSQHLNGTDFKTKYTWSKAPRYLDHNAEAGPLAEGDHECEPGKFAASISQSVVWRHHAKNGTECFCSLSCAHA